MKNEKWCKDCIYFVQHYKIDKARIFRVACGHCINKKGNGQIRKTDKICDCYTERDSASEKKEQLKSAAEYLSFIADKVNELTEILKSPE